jgi:hypothetical protein
LLGGGAVDLNAGLSLLMFWAKLGADTNTSDISKNIKNDFAFNFFT